MPRRFRPRTCGLATCAALVLALAPGALLPAGAAVAPPTERTWVDGPEATPRPVDITSVRTVAAAEPGKRMRVIIRLAERIVAGDSLEVYFSTDRDPDPEVWFAGLASSDFEVYDVDGWRDNDDPVGLDCGRMRFALDEERGVVKFDPQCLDEQVRAVRVNVKTYVNRAPHGREFAPARHAWLPRTAAYASR